MIRKALPFVATVFLPLLAAGASCDGTCTDNADDVVALLQAKAEIQTNRSHISKKLAVPRDCTEDVAEEDKPYARASAFVEGWNAEPAELECQQPWVPGDEWGTKEVKLAMECNADKYADVEGKDIRLKHLVSINGKYNGEAEVKHLLILVVVLAEVEPVLAEMKVADKDFKQNDPDLARELGNLGSVSAGTYKGLKVTVVQVATSAVIPGRHYSGYTQVSGICGYLGALKAGGKGHFANVDLVLNFGTAGAYGVKHGGGGSVKIGDSIIASGALFTHRVRTSSQTSFNWGFYAGSVLQAKKMVDTINAEAKAPNNMFDEELNDGMTVRYGVVASQINYGVSPLQDLVHEQADVVALDMETASEAQILGQLKIHYVAMRIISNGVYVLNTPLMEEEYTENKVKVSQAGTKALRKVLVFLSPEDDRLGGKGFKTINDLS